MSAPAAEFPSHPLVRGRYLGTWQRDSFPAGQAALADQAQSTTENDLQKGGP